MKTKKKIIYLVIVAAVISIFVILISSGIVRRGLAALKSTAHFIALDSDKRVLYESGAEDFAREVAQHLSASITAVETAQCQPFAESVFVYICATKKSFAKFSGESENIRGVVLVKLFLNPERMKETPYNDTVKLLTHELSHLHHQQELGIYHYASNIPFWFHEGLAVVVSSGGGAETVSEADAIKSILAGKHFVPNATGSFFFIKGPSSYGLEPHMFYRQSAMFVAYLKGLDETKFRTFMLDIEDGKSFADSFSAAFGISINNAWQQFVGQLKTK